MDSVKFINRLLEEGKTEVTLKLKDEIVVSHYDGDYMAKALRDSNFANNLACIIARPEIRKHNSLIEQMRDQDLLDDYERGSFKFESYVTKILEDNWSDFISEKLVKIDNKRGVCHLEATLSLPVLLLVKAFKSDLSLNDRLLALLDKENSNDE